MGRLRAWLTPQRAHADTREHPLEEYFLTQENAQIQVRSAGHEGESAGTQRCGCAREAPGGRGAGGVPRGQALVGQE